MKEEAVQELRQWEPDARRHRGKGVWPPWLTMTILMESRAPCRNGKAVGIQDISSEVLKASSWRAEQKIKCVFERRYLGYDKESLDSSLEKFIAMMRKKVGIERLERQIHGIWY